MTALVWWLMLAGLRTRPDPPLRPNATIGAVDLYQVVEIPLTVPSKQNRIPVIAGKDGAFKVTVRGTLEARVELTLDGGSRPLVHVLVAPVVEEHAFVFRVDGDEIESTTAVSVRVLDSAGLELARWPDAGGSWLDARSLGTLELVVVPVSYAYDGSDRVPDTSAERMGRWGQHLLRRYPFGNVHVRVLGDAMSFSGDLRKGKAWSQLLVALADFRAREALPEDALVYGLVNPARSYSGFRGSMAGLGSYPENGQAFRVAAGLGFVMDEDETFAEVMAHELGHNLGLPHAPCNADGQVDPSFPHENGRIGVTGYDPVADVWYAPTAYDLMSYCDPSWISDWAFVRLFRGSRAILGRAAPSLQTDHQAPYDEGVWLRGFVVDGKKSPLGGAEICVGEDCTVALPNGAWTLQTDDPWTEGTITFGSAAFVPHRVQVDRTRPIDLYVESTDLWSEATARAWALQLGTTLEASGLVRIDVLDMGADASLPGAAGARVVSDQAVAYADARGALDRSLTAASSSGRVVLAGVGRVSLQVEGVRCPEGQVLAGPGAGSFGVDVVPGTVSELTLYCTR